MPAVSKKQQKYFGYLLSNPEERKKKGISKKAAKDFAQDIQEVSPPGWGHTKAEKEKTKPNKPKSKIGGSAAAFKRALDDGRFKGLPGDKTKKEKTASMFKLMWSMKNKGDKPHYKPGTDEKKKKYQEEEFVAEREDSPYEKASDKALDKKYGYGTSHDKGPKTGFGRASNRATAAAVLKDIRRRRSKSTSETRADAAHKGWSHTARTSKDQTPEKKATRKKLADTPYKKLPKDEQEKDQVAADAVKKEYEKKKKYQEESAALDANTKLRDQKKRDKMAKQLARLMIHARDQKKNPVLANSHEVEGELIEGKKKGLDGKACWKGYKLDGTKKKGGKTVDNCVKVEEGAAWTKKAGKNPEGGLNEKGRKSYEKANPGSDLKAPQPEGGSRKKSFCARMGGMKKKLTSSKTANDPDSRINKSLRKWKCREDWKPEIEHIKGSDLRKKAAEKKRKEAADSLPPHLRLDTMKKAFSQANEATTMQDNNLFGDAYATLKKKVGSKKKHDKPAVEEGIMQMVRGAVKKKEEKKPEKAMDAGARAKRQLARRLYADRISGSEDLVPDSIRDEYDYEGISFENFRKK